jgi:benzoylformate decarboxylase
LTPDAVFEILRPLCPEEFVLVEESPSNVADLQRRFKIGKPDTFYTFASGGLGWDMPAAVGLALSERESGRKRPVVAIIGDGSFQYSVQSIYTGVQQGAHVIFVVLRNGEYGILKEFAVLEETPNVPGLDLPGLDIVSLGKGYGANSTYAGTRDEITLAFKNALAFSGTSVIEIPITKKLNKLLG